MKFLLKIARVFFFFVVLKASRGSVLAVFAVPPAEPVIGQINRLTVF